MTWGKTRQVVKDISVVVLAVDGVWVGFQSLPMYNGFIFAKNTEYSISVFVTMAAILSLTMSYLIVERQLRYHNDKFRVMTANEVGELFVMLRLYGPTSDLESKLAIFRKNPSCFMAIERTDENMTTSHIVGYFVYYRLTKNAVTSMKLGHMRGNEITAKDVVPGNRSPYGIYISFLWGKDKIAKGLILLFGIEMTIRLLRRKVSMPVIARAGTRDSLVFMRKHAFRPVVGNSISLLSVAHRDISRADLAKWSSRRPAFFAKIRSWFNRWSP